MLVAHSLVYSFFKWRFFCGFKCIGSEFQVTSRSSQVSLSSQQQSSNCSVVAYSPCVDFNIITVYEYARRTKEWCVSSLGSMVAPSVYRISTKCVVRRRDADARWCICGPGESYACSGTAIPAMSLFSHYVLCQSNIHPGTWAAGALHG